jgi:glycine cleavage system regulatory protein
MLPTDKQNDLLRACHHLSHLKITLVPSQGQGQTLDLTATILVTGNDRQGIVSDIASSLKQFDINITEMNTGCTSAPNWGSPIFTAKVSITMSDNTDLEKVKAAIENITDDLMVEIEKN